MIKKIVNYVKDNEFRFNYIKGSLNIVNYQDIITMSDSLITIKDCQNQVMIIKGSDLVLTKILEHELLIKGNIKSLEI